MGNSRFTRQRSSFFVCEGDEELTLRANHVVVTRSSGDSMSQNTMISYEAPVIYSTAQS